MKSLKQFLSITLITGVLAGFFIQPVLAAATITLVDSAGNVGFAYASLELNASGFPIISYYDAANQDLKVAACGNATCTSSTITIVDSTGWVGLDNSLALNASGFPIISYYDYTNLALKVAVCGDATCTTRTTTIVDGGGVGNNVGWYTSLVLNASGFPVISYYDYTNYALKVAVCGNATCTTSTLTTVDSAGSVGMYTSLALNAGGFPVISYYDVTNSALKVAVCGDATCTTRSLTTVDNAGTVGWFTSLALAANNNPVISYFDATNADLKLAVCGDATCTTSTITTVDSTGFVGAYPSLALNASGHPVISYNNTIPAGAGGTLNVAVCGNTNCTAPTTTVNIGTGFHGSLALNASGFPVISFLERPNGNLKLAVLTPPSVTTHTLQASYTSGPSSFSITFSENVNNSGSGSSPNDAANPANYRIINKGANGVLNTASCAAPLGGDDAQVIPSSVSYAPNTAIVNLGNALPAGSYRLFVCGTTSIVSSGVPIPLNFGTDFTFDFVVGTTTPPPSTTATAPPSSTTASSLPNTGFAPNRISSLAPQPADLAYTKMSDIWLEIPSLNVKTNIVGVPKSSSGWNIDWLGNEAGWLNSTAFPTWEGNSVLTAHVYNSNGQPGPFAEIKDLKYGDRIIIHLYGEKYIFEVRSTRLVRLSETNLAFQHLEDASFLTLITCEGYNERTDSYGYRRIVRAVLVEVK